MDLKPGAKEDSNYIRMQTLSDLRMDKVDQENLNALMNAGTLMWNENAEEAKAMIRTMCDEKFGKNPSRQDLID